MTDYAALSKTPHALADGLMLVFQHPAKMRGFGVQESASCRGLIAAGPIGSCGKGPRIMTSVFTDFLNPEPSTMNPEQ